MSREHHRAAAPLVSDADRVARVRLNLALEPGHPGLASLVASVGAQRAVELLVDQVGDPLGENDVARRLEQAQPERVLERAAADGMRFVVPGDPDWPERLGDLDAGPVLNERGGTPLGLWTFGDLSTWRESVAVVGARSATTYGERMAEEVAGEVTAAGLSVVSGGAFGIDVAAHRGALAGGSTQHAPAVTIAVLACGADRNYPQQHAGLLDHLRVHGAVVSEAPPGAAPLRHRFLPRNRIIAALARGTVVVEAAWRSGALNTANWARQLHRPLMGVPGPVTSITSAGVHDLVRSGAAVLVTSGKDVLELVSPSGTHCAPGRPA